MLTRGGHRPPGGLTPLVILAVLGLGTLVGCILRLRKNSAARDADAGPLL